MSHACLLLRPMASLISARSSAAAAAAWFPAYSTAASCAVGRTAEWYSSVPTRPVGRAAGRAAAGVAMLVSLRHAVREALLEEPPRDLSPDEDHHALARLAGLPGLARRAPHQHVHALEDHAARL